jgi:hypothetical protein
MLGLDLLTVKRWTLLEIWARTPRVALAGFLICSLFIVVAAPCWADDASTKAARELAQKIAAQIDHKKKVLVEIVDLTGETRAGELEEAKKAIESELRAKGLRTVEDASFEMKVRVTLSRNNAERILIADCDNDGAHMILMEPFERMSFDAKPWASRTHVDRELVFSGNSPILDFACTNTSTARECGKVLVLYPDAVVLMDSEQNFPRVTVSHEGAWPRALLGRLKISGTDFEARVEAVTCAGNVAHVPLSKCAAVNGPWMFAGPGEMTFAFLAPAANWFQWAAAVTSNATKVNREPFFSYVGLELSGEAAWISGGIMGETRLIANKNGTALATTSAWGSELATVKTDCGTGWQILSTSKRDRTEVDSIAVYEWSGNEFRALSDPLELDGPVVAMWSDENGGPARAVVHNLKTGNYEAYLLKVGCSQ